MPITQDPTAPITIPTGSGTAGAMPCSDCPASTMFEAKKPTYITPAIATTSSEPKDPNCARLWIICGIPICGPCAECSAISAPPTRWPTKIATIPHSRFR